MQATTVAAQGEAKSDYNLAGFAVSLEAARPTVPAAKVVLKKRVDELSAALEVMKLKLNLEFVKNSVKSSSSVNEQYEWDEKSRKQNLIGYQANYTYFFQVDDLTKVSQIYDVLTSLEEVRVSSPQYALKNRDKLNKKALKHAFEKVADRFTTECEVLGLDASEFEIASWEAHYSDSHRSDRVAATTHKVGMARPLAAPLADDGEIGATAFSVSSDDNSLELVAGQAQVNVNLEVGYARKANAAVGKSVQAVQVKKGKTDHYSDQITLGPDQKM